MIDIRIQAAGRWTSALRLMGIEEKVLNGRHQPCPLCQGKDRFRWDKKKEVAFCSGCGHKNPIDFLIQYTRQNYKEIVGGIRQVLAMTTLTPVQTQDDTEKNQKRIFKILEARQRITPDSPVAKYIAKRGLTVLPEKDCYYVSQVAYWNDGIVTHHPAMVSVFRNLKGEGASLHITYLTMDGDKANVETHKKILPVVKPLPGCAIQLFKPDDTLGIAEGIETALAVHELEGIPVWAAGNASQMEAMEIPDTVQYVRIYADSDESYTGIKAASTLAKKLSAKGKDVGIHIPVNGQWIVLSGKQDFLDLLVLNKYQDKQLKSA